MHTNHITVYIIDVFSIFLQLSPLIYCKQYCKLAYNILDAFFLNLSEMFFLLNHYKIWLNIPKCPQWMSYW